MPILLSVLCGTIAWISGACVLHSFFGVSLDSAILCIGSVTVGVISILEAVRRLMPRDAVHQREARRATRNGRPKRNGDPRSR